MAVTSAPSVTTTEYDPLIPIQFGRPAAAPVFCVPGAGANVAYFRSLAVRLGDDTTVYGLQPRGLDGEAPPHASVEETAGSYLRAIAPLSPKEPLRLIGHSFGAWVAFEMAATWATSKRPMAPLVLLDSEPPGTPGAVDRQDDPVAVMQRLVEILEQVCERSLEIDAESLQALVPAGRLVLLRERMVARKLISPRTPASAVEAMFAVFAANLATRYSPPHLYKGSVCMIRAGGATSSRNVDAWRRFAPALVVRDGPGNHMTMLAERHADTLAALVLERWKAG